jgi:hypothetical protein
LSALNAHTTVNSTIKTANATPIRVPMRIPVNHPIACPFVAEPKCLRTLPVLFRHRCSKLKAFNVPLSRGFYRDVPRFGVI